MDDQVIPEAAVEAAARTIEACQEMRVPLGEMARAALEAAAPHMLPGAEWGVFRASDDETGVPIENLRYKSREAAQRSIDKGYLRPEFWEVRGRAVGEWTP